MNVKKRPARCLALLLALGLALSLCPAALALGEEPIDLVDGSYAHPLFPQVGKVLSLETGEESLFRYDVPEDGATLLLFFKVSDHNTNGLLQELNAAPWVQSDRFRIVAAECSQAEQAVVQSYLAEADPGGVIDEAYYNARFLPYWYQTYIEKRGEIGDGIGGSISFPYGLLVTEEAGQPVIRFAWLGLAHQQALADRLAELVEIEGLSGSGDELLRVRVSGRMRYDAVQPILDMVNDNRIAQGLPALQLSAEATALAMQRAAECAVFYSHERPNSQNCFSIAGERPLTSGSLTAENIAAGQTSAAQVMTNWMDSAGHRANILSAGSAMLGVGCFECGGVLYWVQLFASGTDASPLREAGPVPAAPVVEVRATLLSPSLSAQDPLTLRTGEETALPLLTNPNARFPYGVALLLPWVEELRDGDTLIARAELRGSDLMLLALEPGSAELRLPAWEGQEDAPLLSLTVEAPPVWPSDIADVRELFSLVTAGETEPDPDGNGVLDNRDVLYSFRLLAKAE